MIFQKVQETIASHNLIKSDEHIVLGLSGGPDSVCLFHILLRLRQTLGIRLHPVHVNHGLRTGAAERDQNYVEELCREHEVFCKVIAADCRELAGAWHMTSEEAGRKLRYDAFYDEARQIAEKLAAEHGGSPDDFSEHIRIAVAHNADDQAETILFRVLRGTGTDGLAGIHEALRHRILLQSFARLGLASDISAERIAAADRIIEKKQAPKTVEFPRGYRVTVAGGLVHICAPKK